MLVLPAVKLKKKKKKKKKTKEEGGVVVMPSRRCYFHRDCKSFLYGLPRDSGLKEQWLKLIFNSVPETYNPNLALCAAHFKEDCFLNIREFKAGFAQKLVLKDGAVPTVTSAEASGPHPNKSQYDTGFAQKLLLKQQAVPNVREPSGTPQTVIKRTHVISDSGSSCCKSVGTDLSMLDIDDFISEISQLKKEVALLEEKLRKRGDQLKGRISRDTEDSELSLTLLCYTEPNPTDAQESVCESHQGFQDGSGLSLHGSKSRPEQRERGHKLNGEELEKVSCPSSVCVTDGTSRESQDSVWSSRDQPSPQRLVDKLSKERSRDTQDSKLSLTLPSYTDSNPTDAQESVCKNHQGFQDGSGLFLHGSTDQTSTQSQGSVCNGSVELEDCRNLMDIKGGPTADGEEYYEHDYFIPSDENSCSASDGETSEQRLTAQSHSCITSETSVTSQGHTKLKLFACETCGSNFSTLQEKRHHAKVHRVHCEQCGKVYSSSYIKDHMKTHSDKKPFLCCACGKRFRTKGKLVAHERIHTGEKPYKCPHCERRFSCSSNMRTHARLHANERLDKGPDSERRFSCSSNVKKRMLQHTNERPYKCSHCEKRFTKSFNLKRHMHLHTVWYSCPYCKKKLSSSSDVSKHMLLHTSKRLHTCLYCKKKFRRLCDLKYHKKIHNSEEPLLCSHCGKKFNYQSTLRIHQKVHMRKGFNRKY